MLTYSVSVVSVSISEMLRLPAVRPRSNVTGPGSGSSIVSLATDRIAGGEFIAASPSSTSSEGGMTHPPRPSRVSTAIGTAYTTARSACTARATGDPLHDFTWLLLEIGVFSAWGSDIRVMV